MVALLRINGLVAILLKLSVHKYEILQRVGTRAEQTFCSNFPVPFRTLYLRGQNEHQDLLSPNLQPFELFHTHIVTWVARFVLAWQASAAGTCITDIIVLSI